MSTLDPSLPSHWQYYAERACQTHHGRVDDFGYGREELLRETLVVIQSGVSFTEDCRQRLDRIPWNRAKKFRRLRQALRDRQSTGREAVGPGGPIGQGRTRTTRATECIPGRPGCAKITCPTCGKAMTRAEEAAYGSRCEDCWVEAADEPKGDGAVAQVQGTSAAKVQGMLSPGEWEVECRLAAGQTYAEVAPDYGLNPDALKVRVSRWRIRLRARLVA